VAYDAVDLGVDELPCDCAGWFRVGVSSSASNSNLVLLPPMLTPLALSSSIAMRAPFSQSLPARRRPFDLRSDRL
jgi:hypothetical protein